MFVSLCFICLSVYDLYACQFLYYIFVSCKLYVCQFVIYTFEVFVIYIVVSLYNIYLSVYILYICQFVNYMYISLYTIVCQINSCLHDSPPSVSQLRAPFRLSYP